LVSRGDDVHVLGHEPTRDRYEAAGCSFLAWAGSTQPPFIREFMPQDKEWAYAEEHVFFGKSYQSDLRPVIEELAPDVVMVDVNLRYAILEGLRVDPPLVVLCHILYGGAVAYDDAASPHFPELVRAATHDGVPQFTSRKEMLDLADLVLVFTYADFDLLTGPDAGENVVHVGPLRTRSSERSVWVRRFPDRKLVLIALSTSNQNQGHLLQRLCDACAQLDVEALVTTGPTIAPEQLATTPNVTAIDFVNHDEVLPEADLLVTHAGHGTVAAGLRYGVPMLCIPLGRDQPSNARRVGELGLGRVLDPDLSAAALGHAIYSMLRDREVRRRAEQFRESLQAHPGLDDALDAVDTAISGTS
jgi:MGT family glycosyltransferase